MLNEDVFGKCKRYGESVLSDLEKQQHSGPVGVILSARWAAYVNNQPLSYTHRIQFPPNWAPGGPAIEDSLNAVVARLASLRIPVGVLLQVPEQKFVVPICVLRWSLDQCEVSWLEEEAYLRAPNAITSRIAALSNVLVLDPAPYFCREKKCRITEGEILLYHDDNHLSKKSARLMSLTLLDFSNSLRASALASHNEMNR